METSRKIKEYRQLVEDVKKCPKLDDCNSSKAKRCVKLEKCPDCDEINLWSYWQGGIDHLDAEILLVGQDWGDYDNEKVIQLMNDIRSYNSGHIKAVDYLKDSDNPTDMNLCELFESIGEPVGKEYINNTNVFFTNFVLCYREGKSGISGGFRQKWAANCTPFFNRLVQIIQPKIIICLGKAVFTNVIKSAGAKIQKTPYIDTIKNGGVSVKIGEHKCTVFPVAHCGVLGTNNRNRNQSFIDKLDLQIQDWARIKAEI